MATICTANQASIDSNLVNNKVERTIDLTSHLPKVSSVVTIENTGASSVKYFLVAVDPTLTEYAAYVGAMVKSGDDETRLKVSPVTVAGQSGKVFYKVDLTIDAGSKKTVTVDAFFPKSLRPFPAEIEQAQKQLVKFLGNLHFYSPYKTTTQTTIVNCASDKFESYTKTKPVSTSESAITYGPHENVAAFSESELAVHYENNSPFLVVSSLTRVIEVSHWGNIAVEETYDIRHNGAVLKGPFSRYDYQRQQDGSSSVKSFKTVLPSSAKDVYYRDEIGNISTSNLKELDDMVELELRPRFPLFGGWKTHYMIGYNVPSYQYLYNSDDRYALKMRFLDHIFDDQVVEDLTVKIILPEGAMGLKLETPYDVERTENAAHYTYLDTMGRPVVIARKTNLVEHHIQDFQLHYTFSKYLLLQEPLLVVGAFYLLFLTVIIYVRLDFSISKDEASESKMRVAGLLEQVQGVQDCRSALYQSYDDAINKFKASKDTASFQANKKKIDGDYKSLTQQIANFLTKLKAENVDVAEKVAELQRLDTQVKEQINLAIQYAEKLISGKLNKQQYIDIESTMKTKKDDLIQKMEVLLTSF